MVLTTEKDLVRLLPLRPLPLPVAWVPLQVSIEPAAEFGRGHQRLADRTVQESRMSMESGPRVHAGSVRVTPDR